MIFDDIKYHLVNSLSPQRQLELSSVLNSNGAERASLSEATHIISNSHQFEGQAKPDGAVVVMDCWVDRSMLLGRMQPVQTYSTDPSMIFSGVIACATEFPASDLEVMSAGITALGGQWRDGLTKDVTHLFALTPSSNKYHTAMHFREHTKVKILLPHWFDDAVRLGMRNLPTAPYEWPDPQIFKGPEARSEDIVTNSNISKKQERTLPEKRKLYKSVNWSPATGVPISVDMDVWRGRKILLSPSLDLGSRQEAVEAGITRSGGQVMTFQSGNGSGSTQEENRMIEEADVLITRWRSGKAYIDALREQKLIGSLTWLFHVQSTGTLSMPVDQLLHYPIPKKPIEGFSGHEITVTNYTGETREYLKRLINAMGAKFTPSMSGRNTVLIAAYIGGNKTSKALTWSIPIVNHTWLEDCFVKWRNLTVGLEKYIVFPPGVDFSVVLGERGLNRSVELDPAEIVALAATEERLDDLAAEERAEDLERQVQTTSDTSPKKHHPGTQSSANEVEDIVSENAVSRYRDASTYRGNEMEIDNGPSASQTAKTPKSPNKPKMHLRPSKGNCNPTLKSKGSHSVGMTKTGMTSVDAYAGSDVESDSSFPVPRPQKMPKLQDDRFSKVEIGVREDIELPTTAVSKSPEKPARSPVKSRKTASKRTNVTDDSDIEFRGRAYLRPLSKAKGNAIVEIGNKNDNRVEGNGGIQPAGKEQRIGRLADNEDDDNESSEMEVLFQSSAFKTRSRRALAAVEVQRSPKENGIIRQDTRKRMGSEGDQREESENLMTSPSRVTRKGKEKAIVNTRSNTESKFKPMGMATEDEKMDVVNSVFVKKSDATEFFSPAVLRTTQRPPPKRTISVLLPTLDLVKIASLSSDHEDDTKSPPRTTRAHAIAKDRQTTSGSKTLALHSSSPVICIQHDTPETPMPPSTLRQSKRFAATRASQRLRDEIMPDVMNYQQEMRKARKSGGLPELKDEHAPTGVDFDVAGKKKKRSSDVNSQSEDAQADQNQRKKRKITNGEAASASRTRKDSLVMKDTAGSSVAKDVNLFNEDSSEEDTTPLVAKKARQQKHLNKSASPSKIKSTNIRLMTTQVTLSDSTIKNLNKLGVKLTSRPAECTHLLAPHLVRTEKFLCALAVAPYILTENWALDSVAAKELLDEHDYFLIDKDNEKKYDFSLAEAIDRAKANKGRLFANMTFYVTPKVPIDLKLLKNVVAASGGQISTQTPTLRILDVHPDRHVISCPADISIWRPLAHHHMIYTQELLLTGALRQEVNWESEAFKVPGSY